MTWIKLDDGFPNNPKIVNLSDQSFRLYIAGLCYSGKYLTDGFIPGAIVRQYGDATELLERGLWVEVEDGLQVINYTEYQTPKSEVEKKKEQTRDRASRYRSRVTNAEITLPDNRVQITDNRIQITENTKSSFDEFWKIYPRKTAKGAATAAWVKARKKASAEDLIFAAERYRDDPNRDPSFTAHASTWLNQERWLDDPLPARKLTPEDVKAQELAKARETAEIAREKALRLDLEREAAKANAVPMPEELKKLLRVTQST